MIFSNRQFHLLLLFVRNSPLPRNEPDNRLLPSGIEGCNWIFVHPSFAIAQVQ